MYFGRKFPPPFVGRFMFPLIEPVTAAVTAFPRQWLPLWQTVERGRPLCSGVLAVGLQRDIPMSSSRASGDTEEVAWSNALGEHFTPEYLQKLKEEFRKIWAETHPFDPILGGTKCFPKVPELLTASKATLAAHLAPPPESRDSPLEDPMAKVKLRKLVAGQKIDLLKGGLEGWRFLRHGEAYTPQMFVVRLDGVSHGLSKTAITGTLQSFESSEGFYIGGFRPTGEYDPNNLPVLVPRVATAEWQVSKGIDPGAYKALPPPVALVENPHTHKRTWTDLRPGRMVLNTVPAPGDIARYAGLDNPIQWKYGSTLALNAFTQPPWVVHMPESSFPKEIAARVETFLKTNQAPPALPPRTEDFPEPGIPIKELQAPTGLLGRFEYSIPPYIPYEAYAYVLKQARLYNLVAMPYGTKARINDRILEYRDMLWYPQPNGVGLSARSGVTAGGIRLILRDADTLTKAERFSINFWPILETTDVVKMFKEKEEKSMTRKGVKGALKDSTKAAVRAGGAAASRKIATAAMKSVIASSKGALGEKWPEFLDTDIGKFALEMGMPFILSTIADAYAGESPMMAMLASGFASARDAAAAEVVEKGADFFIPLMEKFAETGGALAAGQGPRAALKAGKAVLDGKVSEGDE